MIILSSTYYLQDNGCRCIINKPKLQSKFSLYTHIKQKLIIGGLKDLVPGELI